jgi:hypothetical protein
MASIVRIKRSEVSGNPSTLAQGELAYSALIDNGSNGGDRLYIGMGTETNGNAVNHVVIGGKYFTDMLDHTKGTLTVSSALITDSNGKLDNIKIDNIDINGNTISATDANGNVNLTPNGSGHVFLSGQSFPNITGTSGQYLKTDGAGVTSWSDLPPSDFTINGDTGSDLFSTGSTLTFVGVDALDTAVTTDTVTFSIKNATSTQKGAASFDSVDFTVNAGAVSLNHESIQDIVGGMVSSNTEAGITVSYDDTNGKLDFAVNSPTITIHGDVDGSATMTNLGNTSIAVTLDTVNPNVGTFGSTTNVPVVTVNAKGLVTGVSTASISTSFTLAADTGTPDVFNNGETLSFIGGEGINTVISGINNRITISAEDATDTNKGIATFNAANFSVTSGDVIIKDAGVANSKLVNSSLTIGTTNVSLGATVTSLAGLTEAQIDNININGNTIASTDTNGDIVLSPNGSGAIDVADSRIKGVATPVNATDAANKAYVDNAVTGLTFKQAANLLADSNVALTGSTATLVIDGHAALTDTHGNGYRILLKGQTTTANNGLYVYTDNGTTYALTRSADADAYSELVGASVYIMEGTTYGQTGWVQTNHYLTNFDNQTWVQFSGSGAYVAGNGLILTGTTFDVGAGEGINVTANAVGLADSVAGAGLTYSAGVIAVVGTSNRITVSADAIDIASTYVGQTSITTLGTVSTGTWNADNIAPTKGGTGIATYSAGDMLYASATNTLSKLSAGTNGKVLQINGSGLPVWADLDGGTY